MNKPGMAKYASFRGPRPGTPADVCLAFWLKDLQYGQRLLSEAADARSRRLALNWIKAAQAELDQLNNK